MTALLALIWFIKPQSLFFQNFGNTLYPNEVLAVLKTSFLTPSPPKPWFCLTLVSKIIVCWYFGIEKLQHPNILEVFEY
jgi:hypothetical protein